MKKTILIFTSSLIFSILFVSSCINHEYDLDDIDKQIVFSQNGLNIPVGNFDRIELDFQLEGELDELTYEKDFQGFFTEDLYKMFVIEKNGVEEGIGYLELSADFSAYIKNERDNIYVTMITQALDSRGNLLVEMGNTTMYANNVDNTLDIQTFSIKINQKDITKLKRADILRFTFKINAAGISIDPEDNNYVNIQNMRIKSSGGISLDVFNDED